MFNITSLLSLLPYYDTPIAHNMQQANVLLRIIALYKYYKPDN